MITNNIIICKNLVGIKQDHRFHFFSLEFGEITKTELTKRKYRTQLVHFVQQVKHKDLNTKEKTHRMYKCPRSIIPVQS